MKRTIVLVLSLAFAGIVPAHAQSTATAAGNSAPSTAKKSDPPVAAQLLELKQAIEAQQEQISQLSRQLQSRDQQIQQLQQSLQQNETAATAAASKADAAASDSAKQGELLTALESNVGDLKQTSTNTAVALQDTQKNITNVFENPASIHYKGITITPGGFVAAETVNRTRATSSDINTPFNSIPFTQNALSRLGETNLTARQSRLSVLAESKIGSAKLTGYWEADWLGTGVTSNNRQSNSYVLRQRVIFGQVALQSGWSFTAGQQWTLATENRKGIDNRQEAIPLTIDPQYNVGFTWARQYGFRVVKSFGDKVAIGASIEAPQATVGGRGFSSVVTSNAGITTATGGNTILNAPGSGGGLFNFADTTGYTVNKVPDIIGKIAFDPGWGHYEVFGVFSNFRNRVYPCGVVGTNAADTVVPVTATTLACPIDGSTSPSALGAFNNNRNGGGFGASLRLPLVPKKLELAFQGMAGDGVGRYGSSQLADLTFRPDGTMALIRTVHGLGGLEYHSAKWDLYAYPGAEYAARAAYEGYDSITVSKTPAIPATATSPAIPGTTTTTIKTTGIGGYGSPFANNSACQTELPPSNALGQFPPASSPFTPSSGANCAGDTRVIGEGTLGFWYKVYNGPKGGFRFGVQYSYFERFGWSGNNGKPVPGFAPRAVNNGIWTSIRYYIP